MSQHPTGAMHQDDHLEGVMGDGGIADCGNAQNCVEVLPERYSAYDRDRMGRPQGDGEVGCAICS